MRASILNGMGDISSQGNSTVEIATSQELKQRGGLIGITAEHKYGTKEQGCQNEREVWCACTLSL